MDIDSMKVADLKRELKARNLSCSGTKAELAERLRTVVGATDEAFGDEALPEGELSDTDEGLLNEDDLLKDVNQTKSPEKKPAVPPAPAVTKAAPTPAPIAVVKTAAVLQKEGVLLPMEDNLFSDPVAPSENSTAVSNDPDKMKARAARFGLPEAKLEERAKKFGSVKIGEAPEVDKQKLLDRAKRFGIPVGEDGKQARVPKANEVKPAAATAVPSAEDLEKLRKRAERFGENVSATVTKANAQAILEKRKAKFQESRAVKTSQAATVEAAGNDPSAPKKRKPIVF